MLSKNNTRELQRKMDDKQDRFTLRKLSIGVASVLLGSFIMGTQLSQTAHASDDHVTKEVTETKTPTILATSNVPLSQTTTTNPQDATSVSANDQGQVNTTNGKGLAASSSSSASLSVQSASNNQVSQAATTNNSSNSAEVLADSGATQTPTPAPTNGYSVTMPTPSYATGYNENNVPLDPNTAHQTVQSFIVASSVANPGENAQKGLNNLYAYSISQSDVSGTGLPSKIYFMKFNSDGSLAKTVVIPTDAPGGTVYKIDDYAQITVIKFQNQPATFQLGKQIDDTNRFMPIYNAFNNQVGQGAWGSAPEIPIPSWTTQITTYKDQNGNEIHPPYTQYGWTMSNFTTEPVQIPGYDVRATPNYVEGQYDANIPASQKNGQITVGTLYQQGDEIDTVQVGAKRTVYVQAKVIDDKGTVQIRSWMTYAKEAGTFDPNSSNANDKGRTAAVLPPADYDFETNPNGYKIYNNSDMVVGGGTVGNQQQTARNQAGFNGQVAFQQVRFVYTNPAQQTPPAIGDNARNNAPIDTVMYPNTTEYPDGGYPAGSVRYADAQDYVILPYGTYTWGGYDTASSVTITNPVVFPSDVNYVYWTQTATITYIDDTTGKVLQTDNINGQINSTSKYSPTSAQYSGSSTIGYDNPRTTKTIGDYEKEGYVLVSNNFPTNGVVFNTPNTPQSYEIHFVEGAQEITPNTPADQVPTGTPDDAQPSALSKEVTLHVNYVNSDGTKFTGTIPANAGQSVSFTGTAYVSKVTGQLVNTTTQNGQLVVDPSNKATPEITWTPTSGSFTEVVSPVEDGYYLKSISSNQSGNNVGPISNITPTSGSVTVTVTYAPNGHIIPIGPDGKPIPGAPQPQFPTNPNNPEETTPGQVPDVPGYHPESGNPGDPVDPVPGQPGENVPVKYVPDNPTEQGSITVTVHDVTDNINLPQYGKSSGEQDVGTNFTYDKTTVISELENKGYKVLNPEVVIPTTISKGTQNIVINVEHELVPVTPENPGTPGQPISPNNPEIKWPDGTAKNDLEVTGTQTIHYVGAGDKTPADNTQQFTFTKSAIVDKVTGKIVSETGWNVSSHTFGSVNTPVVAGYHADKAVAGGATITPDDLNKTIVVTYTPNGHIIPIGPDGNPIPGVPQPPYPTNPNNPTEVMPNEPVPEIPGYIPNVPTITPENPGEDTPVIYTPNSTPTTPSHPSENGNGGDVNSITPKPGNIATSGTPNENALEDKVSNGTTVNSNSDKGQQLPQTGNEQLKHTGILGLLTLGLANLLAFGKKHRKD